RLRRLGRDTPLEEFLELRSLRALLARASLASAVEAELAVQPGGRLQGMLAEAYGMLRALPENEHLARLIAAVGDALRARKGEDAVLTFDDLIGETRAVLAGHPAVRERYARRFRAILVDEFQDTDRVQAEIVRLLAVGTPAPLVFVVGDEKQSIYRFRGADVSVFQDMRAELGCELPLGTNFRSVPAVLDFVNALAAAILQVPPGGSPTHWDRCDEGQRLLPERGAAGPRAPRAALHARRRHPLAPRPAAGRGPALAPAPLPRRGALRPPARAGGGAGRRPRPAARAPRAREPRHHRRADRGGVRGDRLRGGLSRPVPGHAQGGQRAQADRAGARLGAQALLHPARLRAHRPPHGGERAARAGGGAGGRAGRRGAPDDHPPGEGARVPRRGRPRPGPRAEGRQPHARARRRARRRGRADRRERA